MTLLGKFRGTGDPVALEQVHEHGFRSGEMLRGSNPFEELHRVFNIFRRKKSIYHMK